MEGKYDITKDGEKLGTLTVVRQGGYTVFRADCGMMPGIFRLSVYGQGREGYLGVLMPEQGRMRLEKKLSSYAMRGFPGEIEFAGPAGGMEIPREAEPEKEEPLPQDEECVEQESAAQECVAQDGPFWYASADGALVSADSGREMVALPPDDARVPANIPGERRIIEGKEYLVYITKELA